MIQIELPQEQLVAGDGVDSQAITEEAEPLGASASRSSGRSGAEASGMPEPPPLASVSRAASASSRAAGPGSDVPFATDPAALEGQPWQNPATGRRRQIALVVAVSACSLLVAATTFGWFVRKWQVTQEAASSGQPSIAVDRSEGPLDDVNADPSAADDAVEEPAVDSPTSVDPETAVAGEPPPVLASDGNQPLAEEQGDTGDDSRPDASPTTVDRPSELAADPLQPPTDLAEPWRVDSPVAGPRPTVLPREDDDAEANTRPADRGTLSELPPGLAKFTPLVDLAASSMELQPTLDAPPTLSDLEVQAPADESLDPMMIANPPEPIVLDQALAIQFAVDSPGYPLSDFVLVMAQISGVPIQIDWPSFDVTSQDVRQRLAIPRGSMSASDMLEQVASLVGGVIQREESLVVLTPSDDVFNAAAQPIVSMTDFGDGAESAKAILNELAGRDAGVDPWAALATREERRLAALAADALRRMRGVKPHLPEPTFSRWAATVALSPSSDSAFTGDWPVLAEAKPIDQLDAPESVAGLLRKLARANEAACLVNWYDARRRRLSPKQLVLPHSGPSGAAMLSGTLSPFRLQVRRVDDQHWWLGTDATYDRLPLVVWTEPLGNRRDAFLEQLSRLAQQDVASEVRWVVDVVSDRVLLLVPRFIGRQLESLLAPTSAS